jgi:hypothetical protein
MKNPVIRIQRAPLLANVRIKADKDNKVLTYDELERRADDYRKAWKKYEDRVLSGLQRIYNLTFRLTMIDVAIAPWTVGAGISFPLIIDSKSEPDEFVDVLAHELIHVLLTDNNILTVMNIKSRNRLKFGELFGKEHSDKTLVHIAVHAGLKKLYLDILKDPTRLERDIDHCKTLPDYNKAWDYVEKNKYEEILEKIRNRYKEIDAR